MKALFPLCVASLHSEVALQAEVDQPRLRRETFHGLDCLAAHSHDAATDNVAQRAHVRFARYTAKWITVVPSCSLFFSTTCGCTFR
jgi:hypothetical protein